MPELPEVETIKRGLGRLLPGLRLTSVTHDNPKSFPNLPADVAKFAVGARVLAVDRRAKLLMIHLDSYYSLLIHLKMTGQLVYVPAAGGKRFGAGHPGPGLIDKLPDRSTRVIFNFDNGARLYFNDQRKFGWVRLMPTAEVPQLDFLRKVGPEPLAADFSRRAMRDRLARRPGTTIKAALLDQTVIAGVGNIYADESLWAAAIHPAVRVKDLSDDAIRRLHSAVRQVLLLSIKNGGSTDRNYVDAEGRRGNYLSFAKVFRRQGQPCFRCGHSIEKVRLGGRGTHLCPHCQKPPAPVNGLIS